MAANTSTILTNLDFDTYKSTLKKYLQAQSAFNDYDFDGSNISVLLDILALNTYHNAFYLNMVGSEMFLDTAQLRDSVVSHAKELNYVPRSFASAQAVVDLEFTTNDLTKRSITIPKGTTFSSKIGQRGFSFTTGEQIVVTDFTLANSTLTFTQSDVTLYEGQYVSDTYVTPSNRYRITNKTVDTSSITVTVIEDSGDTVLTYLPATNLFGLDETSKVFFIQGSDNESYEIVFGDNVLGRKPKDSSVVYIEYRVSSGELPNGARRFTPDGTIEGIEPVVTTVTAAFGGAVSESLDSIRFNAPRHFTTQERAITTSDYETLLKQNFPEINTCYAYGGETVTPVQYGKVFVAIDLLELDGLPESHKARYYDFLKTRTPVAIEPVFVSPEYTYIHVDTTVDYSATSTSLTPNDIKGLVISAILNYATDNLDGFSKTFRYSRLLRAIDSAQSSIISNKTRIRLIKTFREDTRQIDFSIPLNTLATDQYDSPYFTSKAVIESGPFTLGGRTVILQDDSEGGINIVAITQNETRIIRNVGTVDYDTGVINFTDLRIDDYQGDAIKLYAIPKELDFTVGKNTILNIIRDDIETSINRTRN